MIVYQATKSEFQVHIDSGIIDQVILASMKTKLFHSVGKREQESWWNSLRFMSQVISDPEIPLDSGVIIECQIPQTSKRIDFILTGKNDKNESHLIIVELKQWSQAQISDKDGIICTYMGKGIQETNHPSYQAWSYAATFQNFSDVVNEEPIILKPCAYLHNYEEDDVIRNDFYKTYIDEAPVFLKRDGLHLRSFIKQFIKEGDQGAAMFRIDSGRIRPSKNLAESFSSLLLGNKEFVLLDEQKVVYENALWLSEEAQRGKKQVLIIEGGPGTGKSVVAINLLVELTRRMLLTQYISRNAAPREVYKDMLFGAITKSRYDALFRGSGGFIEVTPNTFDVLVVDEAHRLNEKSGMYGNLGENQVKEIIRSAACSVFFIDEDQRVTLRDIGTKDEIKSWATHLRASVTTMELSSQFRCNGSAGYLSFLDNLLQIRETANLNFTDLGFEFKVVDSPTELRDRIFELNTTNNKARMVAGYCWDWVSRRYPHKMDIEFPQYNFGMKWNLTRDGSLWINQPNSVNEIGCIHTCQGLEVDYIGVIIGLDLIVRNGKVIVDPSKRSRMDQTVKGYKKLLQLNKKAGEFKIQMIIKNTYRTLLTRGMRGCYIWCVDEETQEYFKNAMEKGD
jgi:DUF2075 family protein